MDEPKQEHLSDDTSHSRNSLLTSEHTVPAALILLVTALAYWGSLSNDFVQDDHILLANRTIHSLASIPKLFFQSYWGTYDVGVGAYRPLTNLTLALNYAMGGTNPFGYHLVNLLLHAVNSLLVYHLALRFTGRGKLALFTALLFAVHPVHTEAVDQIAGRSELLAATLSLLAWDAYSRRGHHPRFYRLSLMAFFLAVLAKESALALVGVLALADFCSDRQQWRTEWKTYLRGYGGYLAAAAGYFILRVTALSQIGATANRAFFGDVSYTTRLLTMSEGFVKYFQLLVWPGQLCTDYDYSLIPQANTLTLRVGWSLLVVVVVAGAGLWLLGRERLCAFSILFFFVSISIASNLIVPAGMLIAERVLYFPSISACLLVGGGLDWLGRRGYRQRSLAFVCCGVLLGAWMVRDVYRHLDWRNDDAWVQALLRVAPNHPKGLMSLGGRYVREGHLREAEATYQRAVAVAPNKAPTHGTLGDFYVSQGRYDEALPELQRSLAISPRLGYVHLAMARLQAHRGETAQAVETFRHGLELSLPDPLLNEELGALLMQLGNAEGAAVEFRHALELQPDLAEAHFNLGLALRSLGRVDEAVPHLRRAVAVNPLNAAMHNSLGVALLNQGNLTEAERELTEALRLKTDFAEAHNNLGVVYIKLQRYDDAHREFEAALRINPAYTNAQRNLEQLEKQKTH